MANFIININEQVIEPYTVKYQNITIENCNTETLTYGVGLYTDNTEIPLTTVLYLLSTYTGVAWKTLTIGNIVYSHSSDFYLEYLGTAMDINTVYNIDISLLSPGTNVTDLFLKHNTSAGDLISKTIDYNISITDINDNIWGIVRSGVTTVLTDCTEEIEPTVSNITSVTSPPVHYIDFTINTAPYSNLNFQYETILKSTGGFSGGLYLLDGPMGNVSSTISSFSNTLNTLFNVIHSVGNETVLYFRAEIVTRPPIPFPGLESDTFTNVNMYVRNNSNTSTIQTFDLSIGETTIP